MKAKMLSFVFAWLIRFNTLWLLLCVLCVYVQFPVLFEWNSCDSLLSLEDTFQLLVIWVRLSYYFSSVCCVSLVGDYCQCVNHHKLQSGS